MDKLKVVRRGLVRKSKNSFFSFLIVHLHVILKVIIIFDIKEINV